MDYKEGTLGMNAELAIADDVLSWQVDSCNRWRFCYNHTQYV